MKIIKLFLMAMLFVLFFSGSVPTPRWAQIKAQASEDSSPGPEQSSGSGEETSDDAGEERSTSPDSVARCILFILVAVCLLILVFGGTL